MLDKQLLRNRLSFMRQGGETLRYHTWRKLTEDRVSQHTFNLLCLLTLLMVGMEPDRQLALMKAGLVHDTAEHLSGDMMSPAKRAMGIREIMHDYEMAALDEVHLNFEVNLRTSEVRLLKLADYFDGCLHCIEEASLGNRRIHVAYDNFRTYLDELKPSGPVELEILAYIEELWAKYGEE